MSVSARFEGSILARPAARLQLADRAAIANLATRALLILLVFVIAGAAGLIMYSHAYAGRVYQGVHAGGVDLSGLNRAAAAEAITTAYQQYENQPLTLRTADQTFAMTPAEAGLSLNLDATLDHVFAWGREGSSWTQSRAWAYGLTRGAYLPLVIDVDPAKANAALRGISPTIVAAPVDAAIVISADQSPKLAPDQPGVAIDARATMLDFAAAATTLSNADITIHLSSEPARVSAASLTSALPEASAAVDHPLLLTGDGQEWHIAVDDLRRVVSVDPATAKMEIDARPLTTMVQSLAGQIDTDVVDANVIVDDNGKLAVTPSVTGVKVDVQKSIAAIETAIRGGDDKAALVIGTTAPAIDDATAAKAVDRGEALLNQGMKLTWDGGAAAFNRGDLLRALTIHADPAKPEVFSFGLDRDVVSALLTDIASDFDQPMENAEFRIVNGQIAAVTDARAGRELDVDGGVSTVLAAWGKPDPVAKLKVDKIAPKWTAADANSIALGNDVLGEGTTYYGDSSGPRRQNVELAAVLESGWLVPPGGVFSYADHIGPVDADQGFAVGYGITENNGSFATEPVVGGGICQVSTTLFQAVFWSGLPIVERYQHPYYYHIYGESSTGMPGLDAMVNIDPNWTLDFKFQNTTGNWIAVTLVADGNNVWSKVVGTDPGWDVEVNGPDITNKVSGGTDMEYQDSPELPAGQSLVVETASDGFESTINRQVLKDGQVIDDYTIDARFTPSRNLTLRGTGTGDGS